MTLTEALAAWQVAYDAWIDDPDNEVLANNYLIAHNNLIAARLATLPQAKEELSDDK